MLFQQNSRQILELVVVYCGLQMFVHCAAVISESNSFSPSLSNIICCMFSRVQ